MMRSAQIATVLTLVSLSCSAQEHVHHHETPASDAPITLTINPESRVSVVLSGAVPTPVPCGARTTLPVRITNQSFATVQLEAKLIGNTDAAIDFHPEPLTGKPEEVRSLGIKLSHPGPVDLTLSFGARHVAHDLGGRDQIHLVMRCLPPT